MSILILQSPPFVSPWTIEVVDDAPKVGEGSSIAVDSLDRPHISYYEGNFTHQKYAYWNGENWTHEIVDYEIWTGEVSNIFITENGQIHIFSWHYSNSAKHYTLNNITQMWESEDWAYRNSMNMDSNGIIYLFNSGDGTPTFVYSIDGDTVNHLNDASNGKELWVYPYWVGGGTVAIDDDNNVYSLFQVRIMSLNYSEAFRTYYYGTYIDDQWNFEIYENISTMDRYWPLGHMLMEIDHTGSPHICYYDKYDDVIRYAYKENSEWVTEIVANGSASDLSMAMDSNDKIYLSYFNTSSRDLMVSQKDGNNWYTMALDTGGVVGKLSSIAIDSNDGVHISYYDESNEDLKYAFRTNQNITVPLIIDILIFLTIFVWVFQSRKNRAVVQTSNQDKQKG